MKRRLFKTLDAAMAFLSTQPSGLLHLQILHDDACTSTRCRCSPWYSVAELTAAGWADADRKERAWIARGTN